MTKNRLMKVYRWWKGPVAKKGLVAKRSGGETVGGEWVSDEKVSGESCNTFAREFPNFTGIL